MGQIAERAGVNRSTVSLALRNDRRIKPETRQRIQALAVEMGFCYNPTVAQLMAQLRKGQQKHFQCNIAVLHFADKTLLNQTILEGARDRAKMLGYGLELFDASEFSPQRLEQIWVSRGIRGAILICLWRTRRLPDEFLPVWSKFACCCVGVHPTNPDLHYVGDDNYFTSYAAAEKLAQGGFSNIGLAMECGINIETEGRFIGGFLAACHANPTAHPVPTLLLERNDREKFLTWYRQYKPQAIVCIQEQMASWLVDAGYKVPEDVSLAHLDLEATSSGHWAGMRQNRAARGAFAIDVIATQINNNESGAPHSQLAMMTESLWEAGLTVAFPTKAASQQSSERTVPPRASSSH